MVKEEFKKDFKKIYDSYNETLIDCHNFNYSNIYNPMSYLATYLKFMRDYYLLTTPEDDTSEETNTKVSAIMAACDFYDQYTAIKAKLKAGNIDEETTKKMTESQNNLRQKFWQLVALNMEDWLPYDA